ncbi:MAG: site-specific DNA-methyltransferase [Phycisphaerae bacterium]|nr:site-specific DNA-methyltransferase [Phycisphaerae bacterium]
MNRPAAPRNRTLRLAECEHDILDQNIVRWPCDAPFSFLSNKTILGESLTVAKALPGNVCDLIIADPPYNLDKRFRDLNFKKSSRSDYIAWLDSWLSQMRRLLKPTGSIYICSEWQSSGAVQEVCERYFIVRNRITWEREKGRGATRNWTNCSEDIWFCTVSDDYYFDVDAVKIKRRVIAPYRRADGAPKDWDESTDGAFRMTYPSNLWTDITIPFWSMPENTEHPTQKPEKLIAKLILASSHPGDFIFDPFLGSGTTSVVARKLGRRYLGIEMNAHYCRLAEKRLALAESDTKIQGYTDGIFWDRNTLAAQGGGSIARAGGANGGPGLFQE